MFLYKNINVPVPTSYIATVLYICMYVLGCTLLFTFVVVVARQQP